MLQYKYLIWAGTAALVVLTIFLLAMTSHISNTATNTNTVSFDGEGRVFVKPDIAVISFSILTEATTSKKAQDDNSIKSEKVVEFLKDQNIDDKDIKTTGYNVNPQYSYPQPMPYESQTREYYPSNPKITGYQVTQSFEVKVRDLEKASTALDGLVTAGANQVNNLGLQVDDIEKAKSEARELAIKNAKEKAGTLKKQIGIRLGKIVNYYEGGNFPVYYRAEAAFDSKNGVGGGGPTPSIPAGENEIVVNVTITYQIK
jgi:uncharacterized protein